MASHPTTAPPFVDHADEPSVVGLARVAQADVEARPHPGLGHFALHHAASVATMYWSGTMGPSVCSRKSTGPRLPPPTTAIAHAASSPTVTARSETTTATLVRAAGSATAPPARAASPTMRPTKRATTTSPAENDSGPANTNRTSAPTRPALAAFRIAGDSGVLGAGLGVMRDIVRAG